MDSTQPNRIGRRKVVLHFEDYPDTPLGAAIRRFDEMASRLFLDADYNKAFIELVMLQASHLEDFYATRSEGSLD